MGKRLVDVEAFPDIPKVPAGSRQEMGYYRRWLERYEGLRRHEKTIDPKSLVGGDLEVLHCHKDLQSLVNADDAVQGIAQTLYGKWMKPSTRISKRLKISHPEVAKLFKALKAHIKGPASRYLLLYRDAVNAFVKTTLKHFCQEAPECVDLQSFRELKKAMGALGRAIDAEEGADVALTFAKERYVAFAKDIASCERANVPIFSEEYGEDVEQTLEEIIGCLKNSNEDLDALENFLREFSDGRSLLRYCQGKGEKFSWKIDPHGSAMFYALMGLQWFHLWALDLVPGGVMDALGRNQDKLKGVVECLGKLFPLAKRDCFKIVQAIDGYVNYVNKTNEMPYERVVAERYRQNKLDAILSLFEDVAFVVVDMEEHLLSEGSGESTCGDESGMAKICENMVRTLGGKMDRNQEQLMCRLEELGHGETDKITDRRVVIALIREIVTAGIDGVGSIPAAIEYVKEGITPADEKFYERAMAARVYAREYGRKHKGEEAVWNSLVTQVKWSNDKQVAKRKRRGKAALAPIPEGW